MDFSDVDWNEGEDLTPKKPCDKCMIVVPLDYLHCSKCWVCKPSGDFGRHGGNKKREGRDYYCKACRNKYKRDMSGN